MMGMIMMRMMCMDTNSLTTKSSQHLQSNRLISECLQLARNLRSLQSSKVLLKDHLALRWINPSSKATLTAAEVERLWVRMRLCLAKICLKVQTSNHNPVKVRHFLYSKFRHDSTKYPHYMLFVVHLLIVTSWDLNVKWVIILGTKGQGSSG